jgi:excisionase family DNA binding protein
MNTHRELPNIPTLLMPKEVARLLRMTSQEFTKWINSGKHPIIPFVQVGNKMRFVQEDVLEFIETHKEFLSPSGGGSR